MLRHIVISSNLCQYAVRRWDLKDSLNVAVGCNAPFLPKPHLLSALVPGLNRPCRQIPCLLPESVPLCESDDQEKRKIEGSNAEDVDLVKPARADDELERNQDE